MKITQLVATNKKTKYYESVASRLPKGIKTQQRLLNLGYKIAVEDLGLTKAKTLNENFAAKLVNSYHTRMLNEGIGSLLGKAAGHVVGGIGSSWRDAKAGYAAAKGSWDPKDPAAETPPVAAETPPVAGATPPVAGATPPVAGRGVGDIMKAIDGLDPASKKQLAGELEKSINTPPPPATEKPADATPPEATLAAPEATPGATPAAPEATPGATPAAPEATPGATPAAPEATPAAPGATPAAPGATPAAPGATPAAPAKSPVTGSTGGGRSMMDLKGAGVTSQSQLANVAKNKAANLATQKAAALAPPVQKQTFTADKRSPALQAKMKQAGFREDVDFHSNFLGMKI